MKSKHLLKKFLYSKVLLGLVVLLVLSGYSWNSNGAATREEVIEEYLNALKDKNEESILQLVPKSYTAEQAAKKKITQLGGYNLNVNQISYLKLKPHLFVATIQGSYLTPNREQKRFTEEVNLVDKPGSFLVFYKGNWHLSIGKGNLPPPSVQAAQPF